MTNNNTFCIQKEAGKLRQNCRYIESVADIPEFLCDSVTICGNSVTMTAVEGEATRVIPFYMSWEETEKLESGYGVWPKDNGTETLIRKGDQLFDKAPILLACTPVFGEDLPEAFTSEETISYSKETGLIEVSTSWGEVRKHTLSEGKATCCIVRYGDGDFNILDLGEDSAKEYRIVTKDGDIIEPLVAE